MNKIVDYIIELLKWPVAMYMLVSIPALFMSFEYFNFRTLPFLSLMAGLVLFFFTTTIADKSMRQSMQTLAHEFTHSFFAIITLHSVKSIRLNPDDSGGSTAVAGNINWLIIIAPYFFPLFAFLLMIFMSFVPYHIIFSGILGYCIGYHIDTILSQTHKDQTDFSKVSIPFCWVFLPGANLWVIGTVLAFNAKAWEGAWLYQKLIFNLNLQYLHLGLN